MNVSWKNMVGRNYDILNPSFVNKRHFLLSIIFIDSTVLEDRIYYFDTIEGNNNRAINFLLNKILEYVMMSIKYKCRGQRADSRNTCCSMITLLICTDHKL